MPFKDILGQEHALKSLQNALVKQRPSHAYMFVGPDGVGKQKTAVAFAQALNCKKTVYDGCGICNTCLRIEKGIHPDVFIISPDGASIKIKQIRELIRDINLKPYEADKRVFIIREAHKMTDEASNCLLKTLEDPPLYGVIILLTTNQHLFLPTVTSRAQVIKFKPLPRKIVEDYLISNLKKTSEEARIISVFSKGSLEMAVKLAHSEEFKEIREEVIKTANQLRKTMEDYPFFLGEKFQQNREKALIFLDMFLLWFRDLMVFKAANTETLNINIDKLEEIRTQTETLQLRELLKIIDDIKKTKKAVESNANISLALTQMLLKTQEVLKKGVHSSRSEI
ncbi:MAG: polymerase subunit delta [Thermosediminibacterales bacterium]|nr:polymerase subunit delta [Thermosediminibacterales bacterium]